MKIDDNEHYTVRFTDALDYTFTIMNLNHLTEFTWYKCRRRRRKKCRKKQKLLCIKYRLNDGWNKWFTPYSNVITSVTLFFSLSLSSSSVKAFASLRSRLFLLSFSSCCLSTCINWQSRLWNAHASQEDKIEGEKKRYSWTKRESECEKKVL